MVDPRGAFGSDETKWLFRAFLFFLEGRKDEYGILLVAGAFPGCFLMFILKNCMKTSTKATREAREGPRFLLPSEAGAHFHSRYTLESLCTHALAYVSGGLAPRPPPATPLGLAAALLLRRFLPPLLLLTLPASTLPPRPKAYGAPFS